MNTFSLIANSGIQFVEIPLNLGDVALKTRFEYAEQDDRDNDRVYLVIPHLLESGKYVSRLDLNPEAFLPDGTIDEKRITPESRVPVREDEIVTIQGREALDLLEGIYLPLPYLRTEHNDPRRLKQGPQAWARMYLGRIGTQERANGSTHTHKLVLVFDTSCDDEDQPLTNQTYYLVPDSRDPKGPGTRFVCATHEDTNGFWLSQTWVKGWLEGEFGKRKARLPRKFQDESFPTHFLHVALYMTLLKVLDSAGAFPSVVLQGEAKPIDVSLVLDVGNSRTCGMVLESSTRERDAELALTDARRLKIRELWNPTQASSKPFEMKLAFMESTFGAKTEHNLADTRLFKWPSLVRVGAEATRNGIIFGPVNALGSQYEQTFSSPKRYLWDQRRREKPWGYFSEQAEVTQCPATALPLASHFSTDGKLLSRANEEARRINPAAPPVLPAFNAVFPRSTLMTFALAEILLQALSYVNSVEYRNELGEVGAPRRLRRVVLTCPTAMTKTERVRLRECAAEALAALREYYQKRGDFRLIPEELEILPDYEKLVQGELNEIPKNLAALRDQNPNLNRWSTSWGYDEATCSQLVFLYNDIVHRFGKENASLYFETMGRRRMGDFFADQSSLMVASVDIGGGTTDLMICHYECEPGAVATLHPNPVFWEGFNVAGDQIVKRLIEVAVLPQLAAEARRRGGTRANQVLYALFGPHQPADDATRRTHKKLFADQVASVIALGMLQTITQYPSETRQVTYDAFFSEHEAPVPGVLDHVNGEFRRAGATDFDLRTMVWTVDPAVLNEQVVRSVMGQLIRDLCGILVQYGCDYVLLSGRPSTLPAVFDLFLENLPVSPDRLVPMNRMRVATSERFWYPFSDLHEYTIKDPKTCVTVGASIALLSELGLLNGFRLDTRLLAARMTSTADYIGLLTDGNPPRVKDEHLLVTPDDPGLQEFEYAGGEDAFLGLRQMPTAQWIATPLYKIEFASERARQLLQPKLPLKVAVRRNGRRDKEALSLLRPQNVLDPTTNEEIPALRLMLCTMTNAYGYWLDTGIFDVDPFQN
jgi:hypothetical protein